MSSSPAQNDTPACQARLALGHALHDAAVFQHDVMRRYVGARGAELRDRAFHVRHAGVVQHDHVGQAALVAVAVIRRRDDVGSDRGSGVNVFMFALALGSGGRVDASESIPADANEPGGIMQSSNRAGERQRLDVSKRTSFTIPLPCHAAQSGEPALAHSAFCRSVCGMHHWAQGAVG